MSWHAPLCILLLLAFQNNCQLANGLQQAAGAEHEQSAVAAAAAAAAGGAQSGPMLALGPSESASGSLLDTSGALNADDLIAAESSQSPDAQAEHKAFTSAQLMRQESAQQMAASIAPVFANQPPPQQQQVAAAQQQQQQMYQPPPAHLAARLQPPHKANFNPFMAAALAGNYGPAQQQIAAAAAANMHAHGQVPHAPPHNQHGHQHQHNQIGQHNHPQQHLHPQPQHIQHHNQQQQHIHHQHHQQQQMVAAQQHQHQQQQAMGPPPQQHQQQQMIAPQQQQGAPMAVQESAVRHNIVAPPPNVAIHQQQQAHQSAQMDNANSIELNDAPQGSGSSSQLAVASSAQHPVIASVSPASGGAGSQEVQAWPMQAPDIPKIVNLEVKCEKNLMKVSVEFDKVFNGVIFSKGHFNQGQCVHVSQNSGKQQAYFDISINTCGTQGNTQNGLYGMGGNTGSGTYFENTVVIQYDPNVQEVYDHARKLRCTWHDQYEKAVTFRPFPVDMLDIVRADFAGDNVGCWMQIQVGKGPWASEVAGIVKIGQTMTMVLAIKDEENKFDMLVRNCFAHDGKRGPIELVDKSGCITRPKLMSRFTKIKNFGSSATVLSYAHFQAFKFPDSMEVHFQCTIQICRHQCPEQCSSSNPNSLGGGAGASGNGNGNGGEAYSESTISGTFNINSGQASNVVATPSNGMDSMHLRKYGSSALSRERRDTGRWLNGSHHHNPQGLKPLTQSVGVNRIIQVVSSGDLAFAIQQQQQQQQVPFISANGTDLSEAQASQLSLDITGNQICMSSYNFVLALVMLVLILVSSCLLAISMYMRQRSLLAAVGGKKQMQFVQQQQQRSSINHHHQQQQQQQQQHSSSHHVPRNHQLYAHNTPTFDARLQQ